MAKVKVTIELIERAIALDPEAGRALVAILEPIFRVRIGRVLIPSDYASAADIEDVSHDTFVALLDDNGRLARSWEPDRGSFENFAGLIASQRAIEELRKRKEELLQDGEPCELFEPALDSSRMPERIVASKEMLRKTFDVLKAERSALGQKLFELLFIEEREVVEVCAIMNMEKDAVYAWRSRLGRRIAEIATMIGDAQ